MPVLDRKELEESPLSDLHAIASELGIEGYRRLRREDLIDALAGGEAKAADDDEPPQPRRRPTRPARPKAEEGPQEEEETEEPPGEAEGETGVPPGRLGNLPKGTRIPRPG